jgi:hypothetical protein
VCGDGNANALTRADGALSLFEPGGLSAIGDTLYIADTNHDRVIVYDLKSGAWHELQLKGLHTRTARLRMATSELPVRDVPFRPGAEIILRLLPEFPRGYHLNREAPINYSVAASSANWQQEGLAPAATLPVEVRVDPKQIRSGDIYEAMLSVAYCTDGNSGLCIPATLAWKLRFTESSSASNLVELSTPVTPVN